MRGRCKRRPEPRGFGEFLNFDLRFLIGAGGISTDHGLNFMIFLARAMAFRDTEERLCAYLSMEARIEIGSFYFMRF